MDVASIRLICPLNCMSTPSITPRGLAVIKFPDATLFSLLPDDKSKLLDDNADSILILFRPFTSMTFSSVS